jgi:hypothetical protein
MDDIEKDDLGYSSDTVMSERDWDAPLQEVRRDRHEAWENTAGTGGSGKGNEALSTEELWEPQKIESVAEDSTT